MTKDKTEVGPTEARIPIGLSLQGVVIAKLDEYAKTNGLTRSAAANLILRGALITQDNFQ